MGRTAGRGPASAAAAPARRAWRAGLARGPGERAWRAGLASAGLGWPRARASRRTAPAGCGQRPQLVLNLNASHRSEIAQAIAVAPFVFIRAAVVECVLRQLMLVLAFVKPHRVVRKARPQAQPTLVDVLLVRTHATPFVCDSLLQSPRLSPRL